MYYNRFKHRDFNIENLSTKLLKFKESVISCSILSTSKEGSLDSVIVDLKVFLTIFSLENEHSTEHVVTGSVKHSLYSTVTLGYAVCKLRRYNSCSISLIDSQFLISW